MQAEPADSRESFADAEANPKLIRSYDHPTDGRYLLGADVAVWLRDLSATAKGGSDVVAATLHAPLLERMAEAVERWMDQ